MRCISCGKLSFSTLCTHCKKLLVPKVTQRVIEDLTIFYFFNYSEIAPLIHTKHHPFGHGIYKFLARITFAPFIESLTLENPTFIPIDDHTRHGYSHTALLASLLTKNHTVKYKALRASNKVTYSGKSLRYRKANPRNFQATITGKENLILIDDLVTSGTTLLEAKKSLEKRQNSLLFALVLANAKEN